VRELTFDGIVASEQKDGEIWVFLPSGTRYFTIRHATLGTIRDYPFGEPLKEATVYIMTLKTPPKEEDKATLRIYVDDDIGSVSVYINGQLKGTAPLTISGFAKEIKIVEWVKTGYRREKQTIALKPGYNETGATLYRSTIKGFHLAGEILYLSAYGWGGTAAIGYRFNNYVALGGGGGYAAYAGENIKGSAVPVFADLRVNILSGKFSPYVAVAAGACFDNYTNTDSYTDNGRTVTETSEHKATYGYYNVAAGLYIRCSDVFALHAGAGYNGLVNTFTANIGFAVTFVK
jgi:hypothetical protein